MGSKAWVIVSSQISLAIINFLVFAFGGALCGLGIWVATSDRDYLRITEDNTNYGGIGALIAVIGFFIVSVTIVGYVGIFCGKTKCGRITTIVYSVIVGFVIILVIAGAIVGYVRRDELEGEFRDDAWETIRQTPDHRNYREAWDDAQREVHCCGVNSYTDWRNITWFSPMVPNAVPLSCCAEVGGCGDRQYLELAPNGGIVGDVKVWTTGCVDAIIDEVSSQIGAVAGICIAVGIIMIAGMVLACILGIWNKPETYGLV